MACTNKVAREYLKECQELLGILDNKIKITKEEESVLDLRIIACISVLQEYREKGWLLLDEIIDLCKLRARDIVRKRVQRYADAGMISFCDKFFHLSM